MVTVPAVVAEGPASRIGVDPAARVFLIENHDEAYQLWREAGVQRRILIHVDAHHDMWWLRDGARVTIANFISPALREDVVREVYWVVPDQTWGSATNRRHVVSHCRKILNGYPGPRSRVQIGKNHLSTPVLGRPLHICSLSSLPPIAENVLLDIDVDFLIFPRVTYGRGDPHGALPWCWPEELVARLRASGLSSDLVTIAYSVEGGYTPLKWKYLGEELALRLQQPGGGEVRLQGLERMRAAAEVNERKNFATAEEKYREARDLLPGSAAPAWHLAQLYLAMRRPDVAGRMYQQALALDPSYRTAYNSAGLWDYWGRRFAAAEQEHRRTLALDPQDAHALLGAAWLKGRQRQWGEAEAVLRRALGLNQQLLDAYRALGQVLVRQNRWEEAITAYEQSLKLALAGHQPLNAPIATSADHEPIYDPDHWPTFLQLARLYEHQGETSKALDLYRMTAAGGHDGVFLRCRLARLYLKQQGGWRAAGEVWRAVQLIPAALRTTGRRVFSPLRRAFRNAYEAWLSR